MGVTATIIVRRQQASERGPECEDGEVAAGHELSGFAGWPTSVGDVGCKVAVSGETGKHTLLSFEVTEQRVAERGVGPEGAARRCPPGPQPRRGEIDELIWGGHRQGTHESRLKMEKIAAFAPLPRASVSTTVSVKPGLRRSDRAACCRSNARPLRKLFTGLLHPQRFDRTNDAACRAGTKVAARPTVTSTATAAPNGTGRSTHSATQGQGPQPEACSPYRALRRSERARGIDLGRTSRRNGRRGERSGHE